MANYKTKIKMIKKPIKHIIELYLNNNLTLTIFGLVSLESVRSHLRSEGCKRMPNTERLKRIIREIFDDRTTNGVSFSDN